MRWHCRTIAGIASAIEKVRRAQQLDRGVHGAAVHAGEVRRAGAVGAEERGRSRGGAAVQEADLPRAVVLLRADAGSHQCLEVRYARNDGASNRDRAHRAALVRHVDGDEVRRAAGGRVGAASASTAPPRRRELGLEGDRLCRAEGRLCCRRRKLKPAPSFGGARTICGPELSCQSTRCAG